MAQSHRKALPPRLCMLHFAYPMLRLPWRCVLAGALILLTTLPAENQDFTYAATQLAAKIGGPGSGLLSINNRSSFNNQRVSLIRAELLRALQGRGWKLDRSQGIEISIVITLAETYHDYVWTSEVMKGGSREIGIVQLPKSTESVERRREFVVLSRFALVSSEIPLLDVALLEGKVGEGSHLLVLTPTTIQLYEMRSAQWRLIQTKPLGVDPRPNRDLRGRISPGQGSTFDAYLPAVHCSGALASGLTVTCRDSDDPWPLSDDRQVLAFYAARRNYFNGVITGTSAQSGGGNPFFSAAILPDRNVYANIDGSISMALSGRSPTAIPQQWGSNIATIQGACQSDLLLASAAGDFHQADNLTAFRVAGRDFNPASEPVSFDGPMLSLKSVADHQEAIAIVASPSGRYEAYLLTAACSS